MNGKQRTRRAGIALVVVGLLALGGASTAAMADPSDGAISGTVTEAASGHAPIEDVDVCAWTADDDFAGCDFSAPDGSYEITGLAPGSYKVQFRPGSNSYYVSQYFNHKLGFPDADVVSVVAGSTTTGINAELELGGKISGTVTDAISGLGIDRVDIYAEGTDGFYEIGETDSDGHYEVAGLPTGDYDVVFMTWSWVPDYIEQDYNGHAWWEGQHDPVHVTVGETTTGIDAGLQIGGRITGTVDRASDRTPLANIHVCAHDVAHEPESAYKCALTDADGRYAIRGLETGKYFVEFSPIWNGLGPAEDGYATQFYNDKLTLAEAEMVTVTAPEATGGIDAHLSPTPSLPTVPPTPPPPAVVPAQPKASTPPAPATQPVAKSAVAVVGHLTIVQGGTALVRLHCTSTVTCRGLAKLLAKVDQRATTRSERGRVQGRSRTIVIGRSRFSLAAGHQGTVRIKLTGNGRKLLRHAGKRGLKVRLSGRGIKTHSLRLMPKTRHGKRQAEQSRRLARAGSPSGSSAKVRMINPFYEGIAVKPPTIKYFVNPNAKSATASRLKWQTWGGSRAEATGVNEKGNPVDLVLSAKRRCGIPTMLFYTQITVGASTYALQCKPRMLSGAYIGQVGEYVDALDDEEPLESIALPWRHLRTEMSEAKWQHFGDPVATARGVGDPWWTFPVFRWAPAKVTLSHLGYCRQRGVIAYLKVRLTIYGDGIVIQPGDRVQRHVKRLRGEVGKPGPRHIVQYNYRDWCKRKTYPEEIWKEWR